MSVYADIDSGSEFELSAESEPEINSTKTIIKLKPRLQKKYETIACVGIIVNISSALFYQDDFFGRSFGVLGKKVEMGEGGG